MSVTKYRSVSEMPRPPRITSASLVARVRAVWERAHLLYPPEIVPGVFRFRTAKQANEARDRVTLEKMRRRKILRG